MPKPRRGKSQFTGPRTRAFCCVLFNLFFGRVPEALTQWFGSLEKKEDGQGRMDCSQGAARRRKGTVWEKRRGDLNI